MTPPPVQILFYTWRWSSSRIRPSDTAGGAAMVASSSLASIDMTERDAGMLLRFHPRPAPSAAFRRGRGASHDRNANYPVAAISSVAAYALAAGNAMVLKPNEYTPGVSQ